MDLTALLAHAVEHGGSDLHLKVASSPHLRVEGNLQALDLPPLTGADTEALARAAIPDHRVKEFVATGEADFALSVPGIGRFRVNAHRQRGSIGLVIRRVLPGTPKLDDLDLPPAVAGFAEERGGLVLVTGPAGSGKTTTVAALVDRINERRACSIVTIEDPVEVLHPDKRAIVVQREVGTDTPDHRSALARVWRQDPDVVVVDRLREADIAWEALELAETGHLVISTLPTGGASETCTALVELFPLGRQPQVRATLARVLRGIVSQRLLTRLDRPGRVPAAEVLVGTDRVRERVAETSGPVLLDDVVDEGDLHGMMLFDQSLFLLARAGVVAVAEAVGAARDPRELRLALEQAGV